MLYQPFPTTDQLREMYKDVFSNEAVTALSYWTDSNCSAAIDETAYLSKAMETGAEIFANLKRAAESIGK